MTLRLDAWMMAWRYLDQSGQISDPSEATERLSGIFGRLTKSGPVSPLLLANRAIAEYERDQYLFRGASQRSANRRAGLGHKPMKKVPFRLEA
jgi:hypothetical protein